MALSTICLPIKTELKDVEELLKDSTSSKVELVSTAAQYVLQNGGKRIRPAVLLLTAKMLGVNGTKAVPLGAAIEMIHAASLMHDDVLDNASIRRGKPSANVKWGNQISILVGDFLWCKASDIAVSYENSRILSTITSAVEKTTEGEIMEIVDSSNFDIKEERYLDIIKLKTAMLFSCSARLGAILAGASEESENSVAAFGQNIGVAFQLADDVLDYVSDKKEFGKKTGTDLCEGKLTLPVILALKKCKTDESKLIKEALLANSLDAKMLDGVRNILLKYEAIETSLALARKFASEAKESLSLFKPSLERDALLAIADYSVSRGE